MNRTRKIALLLAALVGLALFASSVASRREVPEPAGPAVKTEPQAKRGDGVFATEAEARRADEADGTAATSAPGSELAEGEEPETGEEDWQGGDTDPYEPEPVWSREGTGSRGVPVERRRPRSGSGEEYVSEASGRGTRPGEGAPGRSAVNPDRPYRPEWDSSQAPGSSIPYPPPGTRWREGENLAYPPGSGTQSAPGQPPMVPRSGSGPRPAPPGHVPGTNTPQRYPGGG